MVFMIVLPDLELIMIDNIKVRFNPEKVDYDTEVIKKINSYWQSIVGCFNGELTHVKSISVDGLIMSIDACIGYYKDFLGSDKPDSLAGIGGARNCCIPLSVGAITITSDHKVIVAKREGTCLNQNKWSFPAEGYMLPGKTIENNLLLEMEEELGICKYSSLQVIGLVFDRIVKQPYIAIVCHLGISSEEVQIAFKYTDKTEFKEIRFIDNEEESFLSFCSKSDLTLHNLGKAILYCSFMGWNHPFLFY